MTEHSTVIRSADFELVEPPGPPSPTLPIQVELAFDAHDPFAVQTAFRCSRAHWVTWTFSRELLALGVVAPVGHGDICVQPADDDSVELELRSPNGYARVLAPLPTLRDFLDLTYELVAAGAEGDWLDIDLLVDLLLSVDHPR